MINLLGVKESMPLFLMGHVLYCRSFARGCDVSKARFGRLGRAKKIAMIVASLYALMAWFLLFPAFESPLRPVLACYIIALVGMFTLSLFGHSRVLIVGATMYVVSDSLIALESFVFRGNVFVAWLDQLSG